MNNWNCCRTCLGDTSDANYLNSDRDIEYFDVLYRFTGYKMKINDPLPQTICTRCVDILNQVVSFRTTCQRSHNILLERLNRQVKREPKMLINKNNSKLSCSVTIAQNDEDDSSFNGNDNCNDVIKTETINHTKEYVEFESTVEEILKKGMKFTFENYKLSKRKKVEEKDNSVVKTEDRTSETLNGIKVVKSSQDRINIPKQESQAAETEYQIQCKYCFKMYNNEASYSKHTKRHTGLKVICEHCGKEFLDKRRLLMHCRSKHGYQKTDKCTYCDYLGISPESVKIHERIHTGEKPYKCKECPASFHRSSSYLQHTARHLPEKTVQCQQCPALFKSVTLMRIHANRHKPRDHKFKCLVCGGNFSSRSSVGRHLRRAHAVARCTQAHLQRVKLNEP